MRCYFRGLNVKGQSVRWIGVVGFVLVCGAVSTDAAFARNAGSRGRTTSRGKTAARGQSGLRIDDVKPTFRRLLRGPNRVPLSSLWTTVRVGKGRRSVASGLLQLLDAAAVRRPSKRTDERIEQTVGGTPMYVRALAHHGEHVTEVGVALENQAMRLSAFSYPDAEGVWVPVHVLLQVGPRSKVDVTSDPHGPWERAVEFADGVWCVETGNWAVNDGSTEQTVVARRNPRRQKRVQHVVLEPDEAYELSSHADDLAQQRIQVPDRVVRIEANAARFHRAPSGVFPARFEQSAVAAWLDEHAQLVGDGLTF